MARALFDKNVPYLLRRCLKGHQAQTADDEGWGQISNGELIGCAEEAGYQIIVTFNAKIPQIVAALQRASPGSFEFIEIAHPPKRRLGDVEPSR